MRSNRCYELMRDLGVSIDVSDRASVILGGMSDTELDILYYWLSGYYAREIVKMLHTYKGKVDNTLSKARKLAMHD